MEEILIEEFYPTAVNSQITDGVTQSNVQVVGISPAEATSNLCIVTGQALGNAAHSATSELQQTWITAQAATAQGVSTLFALGTASAGVATRGVLT